MQVQRRGGGPGVQVKLQTWDPERKQGRLDNRCPGTGERVRGRHRQNEAGVGRKKWVRTKKKD